MLVWVGGLGGLGNCMFFDYFCACLSRNVISATAVHVCKCLRRYYHHDGDVCNRYISPLVIRLFHKCHSLRVTCLT